VSDVCRSGCKTRDHASYAACLRDAAPLVSTPTEARKRITRETDLYRRARAEGIQPDGTSEAAVRRAVAFSDRHGTAYDAGDRESTMRRAGIFA